MHATGQASAGLSTAHEPSAAEHRQRRLQQLQKLEAAAARVAHCCRAAGTLLMREVETSHGQGAGAGEPTTGAGTEGEAELQAAVATLRNLLDAVPLCSQPQLPDSALRVLAIESTAAANPGPTKRCAPGQDSTASLLLALPDEPLSRVVRATGKDARMVCRQLWDAYGCPGSTLRQPVPDGHVPGDINNLLQRVTPVLNKLDGDPDIALVRAMRVLYPPQDLWTLLVGLKVHWPGRVTRVELSDEFNPDLGLLRTLHRAVPHLHELKCAWPDFVDAGGSGLVADMQVPCFSALTALTAMCSLAYGFEHESDKSNSSGGLEYHQFDAGQVAVLAPNLRSLEADLSLQDWDEDLLQLTRLSHLTHLGLAFYDPTLIHLEGADEFSHVKAALGLLASMAGRLCSLTLDRAFQYGQVEPGAVVQTMSCLTRLALSGWLTPKCLPACSHLPQLRQLVLGCGANLWSYMDVSLVAHLRGDLQSGAPSGLTDVSLPLMMANDGSSAHELQAVLAALQAQCTGLTSLALGWGAAGDNSEHLQPLPHPWLAPVGGMLQLKRVALKLHAADMGQLGCLSTAPLLSTLWLCLLYDKGQPALDASAAGALARLAAVRDLTLVLYQLQYDSKAPDPVPCSTIVTSLLAAAARMPALEVLDTLGLVACSSDPSPWAALTSQPPPRLQQLVLRSHVNTKLGRRVGSRAPEDVAAAVRSTLPSSVLVSCRTRPYANHPDGLVPAIFDDRPAVGRATGCST